MSVEQAAAAVLTQIALAADGAVLGLTLTYAAVRSFLKFRAASSALRKISDAPAVRVSDLRSLISSDPNPNNQSDGDACGGRIVIVTGSVQAVDGSRKSLRPNHYLNNNNNALVSRESGERGVILLTTQSCIYNEWRGFFGWTWDLRSLFGRSWKEQESSSLRKVPFILVEGGIWPHSEYVVVNMDGSRHPLPLVTVYRHLQPITATPYTFLQALFGHDYPVGLLDEEKILPIGKEITAIGVCSLRNGIPEIKSCKDLPYFMSDMTKNQMLVDLAFRSKVLLWTGVVLGSLALGVLSYAAVRNWNRWKEWRQLRRIQQENAPAGSEADTQGVSDEEAGGVPDGELCVICLMRRRRSAFIPCGHLVCCQHCALSVEREAAPKCPVCRQSIRSSVRIYDS